MLDFPVVLVVASTMTWRFGTFEFDPAVPELRDRGRRLHIQDVPLRVLEQLLQRPGALVEREVFFAELWPHDESGILDDNLNTAVRKLRLALDDSAHHPRFIETVPKHGYRFIAPISSDVARPTEDQVEASAPGTVPRRWRRAATWAGSLMLAVVIAVVVGNRTDLTVPRNVPDGLSTIAVLPFVNASGNAEDRYFSEGLTEEVMDRLSRLSSLRVVSRTSAFAVDTERLDARELGRLLQADALVEGSVRRDGDRLRVSARLVDTRNGYQLWSDRYDRRLHDVFAVQQDIAESIASTLLPVDGLRASIGNAPNIDPVAYDRYLQGRYYWHRRSQESLLTAVRHFRAAVELAPDYARAWTGLGDAYAVLGFYDYLPPQQAFPQARDAANRALALEPDDAEAEATLGYAALYYDWNLARAEAHFRRSIALRPEFSKAHQWYGNLLTAAGRFDEAEMAMRRATQHDPLSLIASAALGWSRYYAGHYDDALEQLELTTQLDPDFELVYLWKGWTLEAMGRYTEALPTLREAVRRAAETGITVASLARTLALSGEVAEAERLLANLETSSGYLPAYEIAKARFALGQTDQALYWLQRALEERSHSLVFLRVDPQLAEQRSLPAFAEFAGRVLP